VIRAMSAPTLWPDRDSKTFGNQRTHIGSDPHATGVLLNKSFCEAPMFLREVLLVTLAIAVLFVY
jgi:hypothetical protein